jgi:hypothetical protein
MLGNGAVREPGWAVGRFVRTVLVGVSRFRGRRLYAERTGQPWLIVSALHGLVEPDQVLEPYDVAVTHLSSLERRAVGEKIAARLETRFGPLAGRVFEVHAVDEYVVRLESAIRPRDARLLRPLRGLRIGEQLAWYAERLGTVVASNTAGGRRSGPGVEPTMPPGRAGLALAITEAFVAGHLDLSQRIDAPSPGWLGMPERIVAERLRANDTSETDVRLFLTFTAAMDRARDADRLWFASERLFFSNRWVFDPAEVVHRPLVDLSDALRSRGVSQRHGADAAAWKTIAEALAIVDRAPVVHDAVFGGTGDAVRLLDALQTRTMGGSDLFPFLRGPKIGPMWVRMLAYPGGASISKLETLPVAVDVQVRKVTEYLGVAPTEGLDLEEARPLIQALWAEDVREHGAVGPAAIDGTAGALDPALWFWGKWGCTRCERAATKLPISTLCGSCRFPN